MLQPQPSDSELLLKGIFEEPVGRIQACFLQGPDLDLILPGPGTVLVQRPAGSTGLITITPCAATGEAEARARVKRLVKRAEAWDAERFGPVRYRVSSNGTLEDVRTGLSLPGDATGADFRALWLSGLPLPAELRPLLTG